MHDGDSSNHAPSSYPPPAAPAPEPLILAETSTTRSSSIVALGFLASTALSAALGLLIGIVLGETPETDALLAAYSLYLVFTLFGANLRVALVPILGSTADEAAFRVRAAEVVARLSALGAVLALVTLVLSPGLGRLLVLGAEDGDAAVAAGSLALLAVASYCQIAAAARASALAAARRFAASAGLYVAGAATSLVAAGVLMPLIGAVGAALGVLIGAIVLLVGHAAILRRHAFGTHTHPRLALERETWQLGGAAAGGAGIPLANQGMLTIALIALSGAVGTVTAYTYGYFLASLLSTVTAASIGFATMPDLVADIERRGAAAGRDYLLALGPLGALLCVPLAAAIATFGRPALDTLLDGPLGVPTVDLLWDITRIFLVAIVLWSILTPVPTIALSLHRFRAMALIAVAVLPVEAVVVFACDRLGSPQAVAAGHGAMTIALFLATAAAVFGPRAFALVAQAIWRAAPAVAIAAVFPLLRFLGGDDLLPSIALAIVGLALYFAIAMTLWPVARSLVPQRAASTRA